MVETQPSLELGAQLGVCGNESPELTITIGSASDGIVTVRKEMPLTLSVLEECVGVFADASGASGDP